MLGKNGKSRSDAPYLVAGHRGAGDHRAIDDTYDRKGAFPYNPRFTALAIIEHYPENPGVLPLLRSLASADEDEQVRALADRRLKSEE